jgi:hypothetical protein
MRGLFYTGMVYKKIIYISFKKNFIKKMKEMNETKSYSTVLKGADAAQDFNNNNNSGIKRASKLRY